MRNPVVLARWMIPLYCVPMSRPALTLPSRIDTQPPLPYLFSSLSSLSYLSVTISYSPHITYIPSMQCNARMNARMEDKAHQLSDSHCSVCLAKIDCVRTCGDGVSECIHRASYWRSIHLFSLSSLFSISTLCITDRPPPHCTLQSRCLDSTRLATDFSDMAGRQTGSSALPRLALLVLHVLSLGWRSPSVITSITCPHSVLISLPAISISRLLPLPPP